MHNSYWPRCSQLQCEVYKFVGEGSERQCDQCQAWSIQNHKEDEHSGQSQRATRQGRSRFSKGSIQDFDRLWPAFERCSRKLHHPSYHGKLFQVNWLSASTPNDSSKFQLPEITFSFSPNYAGNLHDHKLDNGWFKNSNTHEHKIDIRRSPHWKSRGSEIFSSFVYVQGFCWNW